MQMLRLQLKLSHTWHKGGWACVWRCAHLPLLLLCESTCSPSLLPFRSLTAAAIFLCCLSPSHIRSKMASGVKVADKVKEIYNEMKVVKSDAVQKKRIRLVMFHITGGYIEIEEIYREEDLEGEDVFQFFLSQLKPERCGYLLYDCHFSTKESGIKEELVFVMWAPETASIKLKMQYAASKDSLKKVFTGIKHELQINDLSDYGHRETFAEKMGKNVTHLEGKPLNC